MWLEEETHAGQAAVFLAKRAKRVHMLVRSDGLAKSMSRYLIRQIEETPAIVLRPNTEIVTLEGDKLLEFVLWRNNQTGQTDEQKIGHVFVMTGATPNTHWLDGCIACSMIKVLLKQVPIYCQKILVHQDGHLLVNHTCLKPVYLEFLQWVMYEVVALSVLHLQWVKDRLRSHLFTKCSRNRK